MLIVICVARTVEVASDDDMGDDAEQDSCDCKDGCKVVCPCRSKGEACAGCDCKKCTNKDQKNYSADGGFVENEE